MTWRPWRRWPVLSPSSLMQISVSHKGTQTHNRFVSVSPFPLLCISLRPFQRYRTKFTVWGLEGTATGFAGNLGTPLPREVGYLCDLSHSVSCSLGTVWAAQGFADQTFNTVLYLQEAQSQEGPLEAKQEWAWETSTCSTSLPGKLPSQHLTFVFCPWSLKMLSVESTESKEIIFPQHSCSCIRETDEIFSCKLFGPK